MHEPHGAALRASSRRLRGLVDAMDDSQIIRSAYPSEWSIADVLSHLGSSAVIMSLRLDDGRDGVTTADERAPSVWDEWNAKSARAKVNDALVADAALVDRFDAVTGEEAETTTYSMGPLRLSFVELAGLRLNEHVLHTWDVEVVDTIDAELAGSAVPFVVDNLEMIVRFTAKPTGDERVVQVATTEPTRGFAIELRNDGVGFQTVDPAPDADLVMPAESLIRLIYGRLDHKHTPPIIGDTALLDLLRRVFPGP